MTVMVTWRDRPQHGEGPPRVIGRGGGCCDARKATKQQDNGCLLPFSRWYPFYTIVDLLTSYHNTSSFGRCPPVILSAPDVNMQWFPSFPIGDLLGCRGYSSEAESDSGSDTRGQNQRGGQNGRRRGPDDDGRQVDNKMIGRKRTSTGNRDGKRSGGGAGGSVSTHLVPAPDVACSPFWSTWPGVQARGLENANVIVFNIFNSVGNLFIALQSLMEVRVVIRSRQRAHEGSDRSASFTMFSIKCGSCPQR